MKGRLKGAQTGHSLLKKKADALQMRFRLILGKIIEVSLDDDLYNKYSVKYLMNHSCLNKNSEYIINFILDQNFDGRGYEGSVFLFG